MARVLIVEDNEELAELLAQGLAAADFLTDRVATMADARHVLSGNSYSSMILDLGLPDGDGIALLRWLRAEGHSTRVLILTARGSIRDRVDGLGTGADDYLVKPFALDELVARLQALERRPSEFLGKPLRVGNLTFDIISKQAFVDGRPHVLNVREMTVLEILMRSSGRLVRKEALENHLFGLSEEVRSNAVEVYVHRLRKQLMEIGATVSIHTIRGLGYLIRETRP